MTQLAKDLLPLLLLLLLPPLPVLPTLLRLFSTLLVATAVTCAAMVRCCARRVCSKAQRLVLNSSWRACASRPPLRLPPPESLPGLPKLSKTLLRLRACANRDWRAHVDSQPHGLAEF